MEREIYYPQWVFRGVRMLNRGYTPRDVVGMDTETVKGKPYTAQLWTPERSIYQEFPSRRPQDITAWLLDRMIEFQPGTVFYAHNLTFDLFVLLYRFRAAFVHSHFLLRAPDLTIEVFYGRVTYAVVTLNRRMYTVVDTFAFFKAGLGALAKLFDLPPKLKAPRGIGERRLRGATWKAYAMRDAEIAHGVGTAIEDFQKGFDVPQTISAPQLAARIFRKHYIPEGSSIPCPPRECMRVSELSYHGGKNGMYVAPGIYRNVRVYDIASAYPYAMTRIPNFLDCEYVYGESAPGRGKEGIVCLSGVSSDNPYNPLRDHRFERVTGPFTEIWVTTYEMDLMLKHRFIRDVSFSGCWSVLPQRKKENPLRRFAEDFYKRKQTTKGVMREFFKIVLNSLYGKFVQNIRDDDKDFVLNEHDVIEQAEQEYVAGGLYNPLLASLITGYVRAYLTEIEIKCHSLHSSTDSVMTRSRLSVSHTLGALTLKASGSCVLLRPKLYVTWNRQRQVTAFALHGFHGFLSQFLALLRSGKRGYAHTRMLQVKESARDSKTPLTMERFYKRINLSVVGPLDIPALTYNGKRV